MIVAYLVGGASLLLLARASLPRQQQQEQGDGEEAENNSTHLPQTLNRRLARVYELSLRWLSVLALLLLAVNLLAYGTGARYFDCGDPLLRTTAAYLADSPTQAVVAVVGTLFVALLCVFLVGQLYRIVAEEQQSSPGGPGAVGRRPMSPRGERQDGRHQTANENEEEDGEESGQRSRAFRVAWTVAWLGAALIFCVPTASYAMTTTVPIEGSSQQALLSVIHYGAPIYLTLINSLAVPQLARASSERIRLPTSWLLLVSRLLTTWVVPGLVVVFLDNSCGQHWVNFWDACGSAESIAQMDVHGPDGGIVNDGSLVYWSNTTYVDARSEICLAPNSATGKAYHRTNTPQCARAIVAALAPLLLKKMAIAALALPAITVLKWRALPRGLWARLRCQSNARLATADIALDNVVAQCLTWLDVAIVFGPQVPLLAPLVLMAIVG